MFLMFCVENRQKYIIRVGIFASLQQNYENQVADYRKNRGRISAGRD